jgi:hypothetical protein
MDNAVALVRAYLNVNGYFTVAEYPVLEALRHGGYQTATDIDILAFRFPKAGLTVSEGKRRGGSEKPQDFLMPDTAALDAPGDQPDMIIGEVKEGRARMNPAMRDRGVLVATLRRFGCCPPERIEQVVVDLLREGEAESHCGHRIRMMAFGSLLDESAPGAKSRFQTISMGHVVRFLQDYLNRHWDVLSRTQFKDEAFGFLVTLEKALRRGAVDGNSMGKLQL